MTRIQTLGVLSFLLSASTTWAASSLTIAPIADQTVNLGAAVTVPVSVSGSKRDVALSVDISGLSALDPAQDVSVTVANSSLVIATKTSAPSFTGGSFVVTAQSGSETASVQVALNVRALYIVNVLNGTGGLEFGFDSPDGTSYFRAHTEGLAVEFHNLSDQSLVIHGEGAIPHQDIDNPLTPAVVDPVTGARTPSANGIYAIPAILPAAGADLAGYYTIHNVYQPDRNVVFNATTIPAPTPARK